MASLFPADVIESATALLAVLRAAGLKLATAESCTGGLVAGALTEIAGSSDVLERGFVTYSNAAKVGMLGLDRELIRDHGAVSREVAIAMAAGAVRCSAADIAVAVTGVAGPGGGSTEKPVGLVHFAVARPGEAPLHCERRFGDIGRSEVRLASVREALSLLAAALSENPR